MLTHGVLDGMRIRPARAEDLAALNGVIERAVMTWSLPERVKRLSLPSCLYQPADLAHLSFVVAEDVAGGVIGVVAWEKANASDLPVGKTGLLLHGLYVDPNHWNRGIGSCLLTRAKEAVHEANHDGLLVRAQAQAGGFFQKHDLQLLPVRDERRDYAHRYWWQNVSQGVSRHSACGARDNEFTDKT